MGEPETLATHEALAARVERHDYDRLIMLSDGVFAIAITLLALELPLPEKWDGHLETLVTGVGRPLVGYLFAFLMVGAFWVGHRRLMARVDRVDVPFTILNLLLLGLVGLAPLVARLFAEHGPTKSISVYLLMVSAILFVTALMGLYAGLKGLTHKQVRVGSWKLGMMGGMAGAGALGVLASYSLSRGVPVDNLWLVSIMIVIAAIIRVSRKRLAL